jgi:hypothetical protein
MRSLGTRRVALAAGVATVAVIALAGCSAGQVAETAILDAPISGVNTQSSDGGLLIRNLQVAYSSTTGYPAGGNAPLEVALYNETQLPITVVISSAPPQGEVQGVVSARQVGLTGGAAAASPSANPEPSGTVPSAGSELPPSEQVPETGQPTTLPPTSAPAVAAQPARITIQGLSSATYRAGDAQALQLIGLSDELRPGNSVNLTFQVNTTNQPLNVLAPVAIPLSPASRAPGIDPHENLGGDSENDEETGN